MMNNLTGIPILAAFHTVNTSDHRNHDIYDHEDHCPTGALDIIHLLQEVLKFRLNFKEEKSRTEISTTDNDFQHVVYCQPSLNQLSKNSVLLFPTFQSRLTALYKSSSLPVEKDLFVRNVTGNLWMYLAGSLILLTVCLRLSTYIHHRLKPRHGDWSWLEVVQWSLGAICQQGSERHPQGCSCRTMFLIGYMITYMNYTGYAAGITSLLAVTSGAASLPWHRVLHGHLPLIALCNSPVDKYLKDIIEDSKDVNYQGCVDTMEKLMTKVDDTSVALMTEGMLACYLATSVTEETRCDMSLSTQDRINYFSGLVVNRSSPLRQPLNYWLLRFKETGLLQRMQREWLKAVPVCQTPPSYTHVGLEHVQSAFSIIEYCAAAALLILLLEILINKYNRRTLNTVLFYRRK